MAAGAVGATINPEGTPPSVAPTFYAPQEAQQESQASLIQQLKSSCSGMAAVLPFASTSVIKASSSGQAEIYYGLAKAVDVSVAAAWSC